MNKLLIYVAIATFLVMMTFIHYAAWAEDIPAKFQCTYSEISINTGNSTYSELLAACEEEKYAQEDFSDAGVGCIDDCLDPEIAENNVEVMNAENECERGCMVNGEME